jgi:uncharacterized protein with PQ loop repeat
MYFLKTGSPAHLRWLRAFEPLMVVTGIVTPLATLPSISKLYFTHSQHASGQSMTIWSIFSLASLLWVTYGLLNRKPAIYAGNILVCGSDLQLPLSAGTGAAASTRNQLDLDALRLMRWNNWFYEGLGTFLQSSEQGINRQTSFGGGVGRYLQNNNVARISVLAGFSGQNTEYQQDIASQNLASGLIAANLQFFRFNKTNGNLNAILMPVLSDPGRVKFNMNAAYYIKLTGNLSWNVSLYGNWDNRPPTGLSGSDYGSSSGLSWTFGNK